MSNNEPMTAERRAAIKARCDAATPGLWVVDLPDWGECNGIILKNGTQILNAGSCIPDPQTAVDYGGTVHDWKEEPYDYGVLDILPRLKAGDSQRRQSCDCVPERVPASPRLPRGTRLGFRRKHSHVGNFTGTNQPPIPPGLTISPQADTACPAAVSPVNTLKAERQKFQLRCAYILPLKGEVLRRAG